MQKKETLFTLTTKSKVKNLFEKEVEKSKHLTTSGNGSIKYSTTGNIFVDEFANISRYREPRNIDEIFKTMEILCDENVTETFIISTYMRMITRDVKFNNKNLGLHKGQGLKHEYICRLYYLLKNYSSWFIENSFIIPAAGCWEDMFELARTCLYYEGLQSKSFQTVISIILIGLEIDSQKELVKKYLPLIKSSKVCGKNIYRQSNNVIAKTIAKKLFPNITDVRKLYKQYRLFKSDCSTYEWQKLISQQRYDEIDFSKISGKALTLLTSSKFLQNHNLEQKYFDWIKSQPLANFTGYIYELFKGVTSCEPMYKQYTINKQFMNFVENSKSDNKSDLLCCIDISGSMSSNISPNVNISSFTVAKTMALYFSYFLKGNFANTFATFSRDVTINFWNGNEPYEKFFNYKSRAAGNTNPLAVAKLLVKLRKSYPESDFPSGCLLISDGDFDECNDSTTFDEFLSILKEGNFSQEYINNFKLIIWDIPNTFYGSYRKVKFESFGDVENYFYMSGFDPAALSFLLNENPKTKAAPKTASELYKAAMEQPLLQKITQYKSQN